MIRRLFSSKRSESEPERMVGVETELLAYIKSFASQSADAEAYLRSHLARLVRTVEITPHGTESDSLLEMGAYMQITPAFHTRSGYGEVRGCYLGPRGRVDTKTVTSRNGEVFTCQIDLFDAERDVYPYPDSYFATVVCTELIEHLALDPMHLLTEVNRILRVGGAFILSTPNICSLRSVAAVISGHHPGLFQQYVNPTKGESGDRHSREYTPREIALLLDSAGFDVQHLETGPYGLDEPPDYSWAETILHQRAADVALRGDTIHAVGIKRCGVVDRFPAWLYV